MSRVWVFALFEVLMTNGPKTMGKVPKGNGEKKTMRVPKDSKKVPKDNKEAVKWYRKSAEQGNAYAQCVLGASYKVGLEFGVPKDLVHAYAWYNVSQANGYEEATKSRDEIKLTPEQVAKAQALSTEIQKRIEANNKD